MAKKTQQSGKQNISKVTEINKVNEINTINNLEVKELQTNIEIVKEPSINETLKLILDKISEIKSVIENKTQVSLNEMSLTELSHLKELLNRNVSMNNYPGGNNELKVSSNDLIIKISDEVNKRINEYK